MNNKNIIDALYCSFDGLKELFKEKAAKREVFLLIISLFYILIFKPKFIFTLLLLILPFIILAMEALNTAIEHLCNKITLKKSDKIKKIKDLGSAAIFLSLIIYFIVFFFSLYYQIIL